MYKTVSNNESLPPLYSKTRWGGIFEMLNHFFKQEDFFNELGQQHSELDLTEQWDFIKEYVAAFEPVYISTKAMQAKHTSLNDFYLSWMKTILKVSLERAFSALGLVLSDKRTRMKEDTLENILLIKLNQPLLEQILPDLYEWNKEDV
uniref:HAT C-terminal dimerisation domain-containing protein n=1 Tax=Anopheles arabiensis TaxID=7173 RepID=A0A182ICV7_ANOAR